MPSPHRPCPYRSVGLPKTGFYPPVFAFASHCKTWKDLVRFQKASEIRGTLEGRLAGEFPKQTVEKNNDVFLFSRCILVCVCGSEAGAAAAAQNANVCLGCVWVCGLTAVCWMWANSHVPLKYTCRSTCFIGDSLGGQFSSWVRVFFFGSSWRGRGTSVWVLLRLGCLFHLCYGG